MKFGEMPIADAEGAILAHSVRIEAGTFKKGRRLSAADIAALREGGAGSVFAARLEADDLPEDAAAGAIARAAAGAHAIAAEPFTGRANLYAEGAGVALIDAERVRRLNRLHESLTLATVAPFELVEPRQMLATVKVIPFAAPKAVVAAAAAICREAAPIVALAPLRPHRAGLIVTRLPQTREQLVEKSVTAIRRRLEALGSTLAATRVCGHTVAEVAAAIGELLGHGLAPILIFGASAIVDRGDVIPAAVVAAQGGVVHLGMPVDPGNLMMFARVGETAVIGVPSCARSPKLNGFDWVLQRTLAGLALRAEDIMDLGAGGLLKEIPSRPAPREAGEPPAIVHKAPAVAAIVLAAGRSTRMGGENKLLRNLGGVPMVRRVVEAALGSKARPVLVVLGNEAARVRAALAGLEVAFADNPHYAEGLSTSLKAGIAALPGGEDGAVVLLGDMPLVEPRHIDTLMAAFDPGEGRAICVPVHRGKRGNPVLWGADFFADMTGLAGDIGAKHLMSRYADQVCEVDLGSEAVLADADTPEGLAALAERLPSAAIESI